MLLSSDIKNKKCAPLDASVNPLTPEEYDEFLRQELTGWQVFDEKRIEKEFTFKDFKEALAFINKVGDLAEDEGHHPDVLLHGWNKVRFMLSTHSIGGLSENDFILATKIDNLR